MGFSRGEDSEIKAPLPRSKLLQLGYHQIDETDFENGYDSCCQFTAIHVSALCMRLWILAFMLCTSPPLIGEIDPATADTYARLVLKGVEQEYPNKPSNVMANATDVLSPRAMHPAFYGNFDWHSSVHGHWMLLTLLRTQTDLDSAPAIEALMDRHLTPEKMRAEAAYWDKKHNASYERMYGWAWALHLARELHVWKKNSPDDPRPDRWLTAFQPLEKRIVEMTETYLPKLTYPIRVGTHTDTAFALNMIHDYAAAVGNTRLAKLIASRAHDYYSSDTNYPVAYEPSGHDFFSPGLNEADLMRRVLAPADYERWLTNFFPGLAKGELGTLLIPVEVSDESDGHLVHLAGLNFCRAWTMAGIAKALPADDPRTAILRKSAAAHLAAGMPYLNSGHYEGDHWLASFAIYALQAQ